MSNMFLFIAVVIIHVQGEEAWTISDGQSPQFLNDDTVGRILIMPGSCNDTDANNDDESEAQLASNDVMCYESCLHHAECIAFRMEWSSSGDNDASRPLLFEQTSLLDVQRPDSRRWTIAVSHFYPGGATQKFEKWSRRKATNRSGLIGFEKGCLGAA